MNDQPNRKQIRIKNYDYSAPGAYFITVCVANRKPILWNVGAAISRPNLSKIGAVVEMAILQISERYPMISVDKYCIMPDHIHMILSIHTDVDGRPQVAPTISRVMKQFKGSITKQIGRLIWQKSFYDHGIRNRRDYDEIWEYIENNPLKYALKKAP